MKNIIFAVITAVFALVLSTEVSAQSQASFKMRHGDKHTKLYLGGGVVASGTPAASIEYGFYNYGWEASIEVGYTTDTKSAIPGKVLAHGKKYFFPQSRIAPFIDLAAGVTKQESSISRTLSDGEYVSHENSFSNNNLRPYGQLQLGVEFRLGKGWAVNARGGMGYQFGEKLGADHISGEVTIGGQTRPLTEQDLTRVTGKKAVWVAQASISYSFSGKKAKKAKINY